MVAGAPESGGSSADVLMSAGRWHEALEALGAGDSDADVRTLCLAAVCAGRAGSTVEAANYAQRAVAADEGDEWAQRLLATSLTLQADADSSGHGHRLALRAMQHGAEAVRLAPDNPQGQWAYGEAAAAAGNLAEALVAAGRAERLSPGHSETWHLRARVALGRGSPFYAERAARESIRLYPGAAMPWSVLGTSLERQGRYTEAAGVYNTVIDLDPSLARIQRSYLQPWRRVLFSVAILLPVPLVLLPSAVVGWLLVTAVVAGAFRLGPVQRVADRLARPLASSTAEWG